MMRRALVGMAAVVLLPLVANACIWYQVRRQADRLSRDAPLAFLPASISWPTPSTIVLEYRLNPEGYAVSFTWRTRPWGEIEGY